MEEKQKKDALKEETPEEIKELVIARLDMFPRNKKISIGSHGDFTKKDLIERIEKGDEVGQKMIEIELELLRAQREGALLEEMLSSDDDQQE